MRQDNDLDLRLKYVNSVFIKCVRIISSEKDLMPYRVKVFQLGA